MYKLISALFCWMASGVFAQPMPQPGERVGPYVARWDAWVESIPEDQKAWELIQEVEGALEQPREDGHWLEFAPESDPENLEVQSEWAWTVAFVEHNQALIEQIHAYARRPFSGVPLGDSSLIYQRLGDEGYVIDYTPTPKTLKDIVPSYVGMMRSHLSLLLTDMLLADQEKDFDRVLLDVRAIAGMARLSRTTNSYLDQLVVQSFGGAICRRILEHDIRLDQFSDLQLQELMGIMEAVERLYDPASAVQFERIASGEFLDWIFEDSDDKGRIGPLGVARLFDLGLSNNRLFWLGLKEDQLMMPSNLEAALGAILLQSRIAGEQYQRDYVKTYFDAVEADLRVRLHNLKSWSTPDIHVQNMDFTFEWMIAPALYATAVNNLPFTLSHAPTELHAVELLIALHRSKIRYGVFPVVQTDLDVDLIATVPIDLFSGLGLNYRLVDGQPVIYSVGTDRDDDGGRPIAGWDRDWVEFLTLDELEAINKSDPASIDGDWILYPAIQ